MKVLVVEDDRGIRAVLTQALQMFGHDPFKASNTEEATKVTALVKPDVILLDLLLEGTLATPFIEVAREMMKERPPRIIVVSALNEAVKVAEANQADFLKKPFDIYDLKKLIEGK